ncbi:hypothetical protein TspCOW1_13610 [Thiohalobacter sp. COW1]|uniref:Fe2+/Zn2+ uptake regulation proteins n=1 Tax=Thiohalobacter thiocyanaticus TaxID=585455 RepID=A0A1Z4VPT7_9GAMM|nr:MULTISPECIES: hypothetical protein [Thiohalobacter]BAZ93656.1 Fe2+/Zn2+ uptake regulation proteins [Thiohalobacter thiocyanaticus]BCO31258.1 hypothetical protein TspCOW1_13610 [Thiohalobacter sp. COW1]
MPSRRKKTGFGGWLFLLLVLTAYGITGVIDTETTGQALRFSATVMLSALPAVVMVFFLLLAADLLFKPAWIKRHLGRTAGVNAWLLAVVGGVLASGPVYAWYPLLRELRDKGMRAPLAAVFLYSRAVKLPLLPLMIHYFGLAYTLVLCLYLLGFSIANGVLMEKLENPGEPSD